jgi:hypothetical protein
MHELDRTTSIFSYGTYITNPFIPVSPDIVDASVNAQSQSNPKHPNHRQNTIPIQTKEKKIARQVKNVYTSASPVAPQSPHEP